jgi:hypothetical protein
MIRAVINNNPFNEPGRKLKAAIVNSLMRYRKPPPAGVDLP